MRYNCGHVDCKCCVHGDPSSPFSGESGIIFAFAAGVLNISVLHGGTLWDQERDELAVRILLEVIERELQSLR